MVNTSRNLPIVTLLLLSACMVPVASFSTSSSLNGAGTLTALNYDTVFSGTSTVTVHQIACSSTTTSEVNVTVTVPSYAGVVTRFVKQETVTTTVASQTTVRVTSTLPVCVAYVYHASSVTVPSPFIEYLPIPAQVLNVTGVVANRADVALLLTLSASVVAVTLLVAVVITLYHRRGKGVHEQARK